MSFREALERKGCRLSKLDEAAAEFTPVEATLNNRRAWEFEGTTSRSLDRLIDLFLDARPHYRHPAKPKLEAGSRFRFVGGETEFEVVSIDALGRLVYVEPDDPQRYACEVDRAKIDVLS